MMKVPRFLFRKKSNMQRAATIGIDCRLAGTKHAGIGRYISSLLSEMLKIENAYHWILFFYDESQANEFISQLSKAEQKKLESTVKLRFVSIRHYGFTEQLLLPLVFAKERLSLLHVPHFNAPILYPGRIILTIHDLLWHDKKGTGVTTLPAWQYWLKYVFYRLVSWTALHRAAAILTPTKTVEQAITNRYPDLRNKISVTYEGVSNLFFAELSKARLNARQLLYVGSLYPHKNISVIFRALKKLPKYSLIVVGSRDNFQKQAATQTKKIGVADQVEFVGYVDDKKLIELYQSSLATVQPSLSEGFGLPGLEAMAAGGVVVASDLPIFREVYGEAARFFDPQDADSLVKAIVAINRQNSQNRKIQQNKSREHAKEFTWKKAGEKTLAVYAEVLRP